MRGPLILAAVVAATSGCGRSNLSFADRDGPDEVEVISAGMVSIEGRRVRLAGIDVPREAPQAACWAEALLAREAQQALGTVASSPGRVDVQPGGTTRAGHAAARVFVNGTDLSLFLVREGLAAPTGGAAWDWCGPLTIGARNAPRLNYATR
ncbi:MAG TPA: thermonuclease family protein [Caulobacteraceae bacterium]